MRIIKRVIKEINIKNVTYPVEIIYKSEKKNISYRFKDNKFVITSPIFAKYQTIEQGLIKFAPRLMEKSSKPLLFSDNFIYLLGKRYELKDNALIIDENNLFRYKDLEDLKKKLKKWFCGILNQEVDFYKKQMNITQPLKVRVKEMKTRYGSYSRQTQSLSFGFELMHYELEVSKAVVVHELAHYYVFDHSKRFYKLVLENYPNYFEVHSKLRKGIC